MVTPDNHPEMDNDGISPSAPVDPKEFSEVRLEMVDDNITATIVPEMASGQPVTNETPAAIKSTKVPMPSTLKVRDVPRSMKTNNAEDNAPSTGLSKLKSIINFIVLDIDWPVTIYHMILLVSFLYGAGISLYYFFGLFNTPRWWKTIYTWTWSEYK